MSNSTTAAAPPPPPFKVYLPGERADESRGGEIIGSTIAVTVMALIVVALRVYVKFNHSDGLAIEDYLMVLAVIVLASEIGLVIPQVFAGAGRHIEYIAPDNFVRAMFYNFATQPISRLVKWAIHIAAVITALLTVVGIAQALTQCTPMAFTWDKSIVGGQCVSQTYLVISSYVSSSLSCTIDFALAALPIPMLWNVQLPRRVKFAVIGILSLGFFTVAAAITKTFTAEIAVAIIAGSIPCLKSLFKRILASTRRYGSGSKPPSNYVCSCGKPYMQSADASRSGSGVSKNASSHHASASRDRRSNGAALRSKGFGTDGSSSARRKAADPYSITGIDGGSGEDFEMYSPTSSGRKVPWSVVDPSLMMPGVMAVSRSHERRTSDEEVIIIQQPHSGGGRCRRRRGASRRRRTSPSLSRTPTGKRASGI
ncbi:hypothetical protein GGTG_07230 [Gaeumannomyces tritici R3-111a-1]|uniref:Rhodopsin domain-containing protein n=1 Tax=Gaeumannomyces tritici (strain R3-111a-1) TaxID=644352 RepID=J3P133_GAET3|nr:hypothetical protein GGTG_07230 [Gaeumannomyces tritici R3-111a-1]EJT77318.1 hypothetical protein GGTG_07230 [Gaeumannomyces tritici R3-111a-1]